jgi:ribonuclease T1
LRQRLELSALILYHSAFGIQGKPVLLSGRPLAWQTPRKLGLAITVVGALLTSVNGLAKGPVPAAGTVSVAELPREAVATEASIRAGGPFADSKDGSVFGNRERRLPAQSYGYYREYTVPTPGAHDRGPRRIIAGRKGERYYTEDHYRRFKRIVE